MTDHSLRFLSSLKRSRDVDKSLQALYNTATADGFDPTTILHSTDDVLPGLKETVDFTKFKKTSSKLNKKPLQVSSVDDFGESMKETVSKRRKLLGFSELVDSISEIMAPLAPDTSGSLEILKRSVTNNPLTRTVSRMAETVLPQEEQEPLIPIMGIKEDKLKERSPRKRKSPPVVDTLPPEETLEREKPFATGGTPTFVNPFISPPDLKEREGFKGYDKIKKFEIGADSPIDLVEFYNENVHGRKDFSRIGSGKMDLDTVIYSVKRLIDDEEDYQLNNPTLREQAGTIADKSLLAPLAPFLLAGQIVQGIGDFAKKTFTKEVDKSIDYMENLFPQTPKNSPIVEMFGNPPRHE